VPSEVFIVEHDLVFNGIGSMAADEEEDVEYDGQEEEYEEGDYLDW
jgi:hypothetical protein